MSGLLMCLRCHWFKAKRASLRRDSTLSLGLLDTIEDQRDAAAQ